MKQIERDELLKVFQAFDPEATGNIAFDVINRALTTYGERLSKEEANRFYQLFKIKHGETISYNELVEEIIKI